MKKIVITFIVISGILFVGFILAANSKQNFGEEDVNIYQQKEGYELVSNDTFGFKYQYKNSLNRINQYTEESFDLFKIVYSDFIRKDIVDFRGFQYPGIDLTIFDNEVMDETGLEQWVSKVSTDNADNILSNRNLRYTTTSHLVLSDPNFIFFINSVPSLGGGPLPTLLIFNEQNLFQITQYGTIYNFNDYVDLIETLQIKKDDKFIQLTQDDLNSIKDYYYKNENS